MFQWCHCGALLSLLLVHRVSRLLFFFSIFLLTIFFNQAKLSTLTVKYQTERTHGFLQLLNETQYKHDVNYKDKLKIDASSSSDGGPSTRTTSMRMVISIQLQARCQYASIPVSVLTIVWNPEGKFIYQSYEHVGAVVDRLEANAAGEAAVFELLHHAGLKTPANPGDKVFRCSQSVGHI